MGPRVSLGDHARRRESSKDWRWTVRRTLVRVDHRPATLAPVVWPVPEQSADLHVGVEQSYIPAEQRRRGIVR